MTRVGVVAHGKKSVGGGLPELRRRLAERGVDDPLWYQVAKSRDAPAAAEQAIADGADRLILWGGDGTIQRSLGPLAGSGVTLGVIPAGTANLLAGNLGIPDQLAAAVDVALDGPVRELDLGVLNGERFAVMGGVGFDAYMMKGARRALKRRLGRLAYVWTGVRATRVKPVTMSIAVDGEPWAEVGATALLLGNLGALTGGLRAFPDARPDDGRLDIGLVTAVGPAQWARVLTRLGRGAADGSPFVRTTRGARLEAELARPIPYELDGGARGSVRRIEARVEPRSLRVAVPGRDGRRP